MFGVAKVAPPSDLGRGGVRALHRDLQALLPSAKYAYDKNRRNENRYDDGNKAKKKLGLRGQCEHQAVIRFAGGNGTSLFSSIGITMRFRNPPGVNNCTISRLTHRLRIPPDRTRLKVMLPRLPFGTTGRKLIV